MTTQENNAAHLYCGHLMPTTMCVCVCVDVCVSEDTCPLESRAEGYFGVQGRSLSCQVTMSALQAHTHTHTHSHSHTHTHTHTHTLTHTHTHTHTLTLTHTHTHTHTQ